MKNESENPENADSKELNPLSGWQPIETAPRDGTPIIVDNPHNSEEPMLLVVPGFGSDWSVWGQQDDPHACSWDVEPTKWHPAPKL